jgi:hypothetical protein
VEVRELGLSLRHPRLRDVLYQGMDLEERRSLHRRFAAELERLSGGELRERAADLGYHYAEGGVDRRALECMVVAGDLRYEGFAYFDAGEAYRRALALLPAAPRGKRLDLERKLNDRLGRIGFYHDHRGAPPYLERARSLHLRHGLLWMIAPLGRLLGASLGVALALAGTVLWNVANRRRHPVRRALEHLLDSFAATAYLCNCHTYAGHQARALAAAEYLRPFVYSKRRLPQVGYLIARAPALLFTHRLLAAAAACEQALAILERDQRTPVAEHDRVHATGGALVTRLWTDLARGYWRSPWWQRVEDYVKTHSTALLETWLLELRLFAAYRRGHLGTARDLWQELVEKAKLSEIFFVQGKGCVWFGMACLEAGHTSEAQDLADDLIRQAREQDNPMLLAMGLLLRGMALHAWEQLGDAGCAFEEAARLTRREDVGARGVYRDVLLAQAALCLDLGQPNRAATFLSQVEEAIPPVEPPHELHQLRATRMLGQVALAEQAPALAIRRFSEALELAERLEDSLESGLATHGLSQALALAGEAAAAAERRADARRILTERGATHQLRRLAYSDHPRRHRPEASPTSPGAPLSTPIEPESKSEDNPILHLGDTQPGLNSTDDT